MLNRKLKVLAAGGDPFEEYFVKLRVKLNKADIQTLMRHEQDVGMHGALYAKFFDPIKLAVVSDGDSKNESYISMTLDEELPSLLPKSVAPTVSRIFKPTDSLSLSAGLGLHFDWTFHHLLFQINFKDESIKGRIRQVIGRVSSASLTVERKQFRAKVSVTNEDEKMGLIWSIGIPQIQCGSYHDMPWIAAKAGRFAGKVVHGKRNLFEGRYFFSSGGYASLAYYHPANWMAKIKRPLGEKIDWTLGMSLESSLDLKLRASVSILKDM